MKFLADMGVSTHTIRWLRDQGFDAVHLREQGLHRLPDAAIMEKARLEGRILLTMDLDFGYLLAISGEKVPSVILFRLDDERSEVVINRLADVLSQLKDEIEAGAIISISEKMMRVRLLPI